MIEVVCPDCACANAVPEGVPSARARCAECESPLTGARQVRYRAAGEGRAWGVQVLSDLRMRAEWGSLSPRMLISEEGGPWFRARERRDLNWPGAPAQAKAPRPRRRTASVTRPVARPVPSSVLLQAGLMTLGAVVSVLMGFGALFVLSDFGAGGAGFLVLLVMGVVSVAQVGLANGLRRGSETARGLTLGLAGIAGLVFLLLVGQGANGIVVLIGAIVIVTPFLTLTTQEARDWFRLD